MKQERVRKILLNLSDTEYISSEILASTLELSSKTIRNEIKEINELLRPYESEIEIRPKLGCRLKIENFNAYKVFFSSLSKNQDMEGTDSIQTRVQNLLEYFLNAKEWIRIEDLCEMFFVSQSALSKSLKEVRQFLMEYNIRLDSKPGYGLKAIGSEFDMRLCMANASLLHTEDTMNGVYPFTDKQKSLADINRILDQVFANVDYHMSDVSFQNLLIHIFIALQRIAQGKSAAFSDKQDDEIRREPEFLMAMEIVKKLSDEFHMKIPEEEAGYITIHLAAKKIVPLKDSADNIVITDEINEIVTHMLDAVEHAYQIDLHDDFELRMMLALHLAPFGIRMAYDLVLHNPILKDIKTNYTFAYNLAVAASDELHKHYHKQIKEDEIGYFALHFNMALERRKTVIEKMNILIVCGTGRGTAQLLVYRFRENFGKYLNHISTCDTLHVRYADFSIIDYVITTVPIQFKVPVPILEIKTLMEDRDMKYVHRFLSGRHSKTMERYFQRELFLTNVEAETKEEVLTYMVSRIRKIKPELPSEFLDAVKKREKQAVTEFGNFIAIPHPYKAMTQETFVCVCILKKAIVWDKRKVQLIYMTSMETGADRDLRDFYKITSKLLVDAHAIREIIQKKDYDEMLAMFAGIEEQLGNGGA